LSQYRNPNHPAGPLYPQSPIAVGGNNGGKDRTRDVRAQMSEAERDPVFQAIWRGEREALGASLSVRRPR